jgi:hypothetical protein
MFLSRYQDRESTLKMDHEIAVNDRKGAKYSLHDFDITVWADGEVTARRKHYTSTAPNRHFPNMAVEEGSISLPIEDLVSFILERITPSELADGLIGDDEARESLVHKMSERYASPTFLQGDRRTFLTRVQQQVYAEVLDRVIERLNHAETNKRSRDDYYRFKAIEIGWYRGLYEHALRLVEGDEEKTRAITERHSSPDQLAAYIKENRDPAAMESAGPQWHESRDFWRKKLMEFFPEPEIGAEEPPPS